MDSIPQEIMGCNDEKEKYPIYFCKNCKSEDSDESDHK